MGLWEVCWSIDYTFVRSFEKEREFFISICIVLQTKYYYYATEIDLCAFTNVLIGLIFYTVFVGCRTDY